jgi:hypothetical protein
MEKQNSRLPSTRADGRRPQPGRPAKERAINPDIRAALNMREALQNIPKSLSKASFPKASFLPGLPCDEFRSFDSGSAKVVLMRDFESRIRLLRSC